MREMKQTGIDWIGKMPKDWKIKRLKNYGWARSGVANKKPEDFGFGFPFLNYKNVYKNFVVDSNAEELVNSTEEDKEKYSVKKGDTFFTGSSETIEELGLSAVAMEDWKDAVFNGFTIRVRPYHYGKDIDVNYTKYLFRSEVCRGYLSANDNSITRANLSQQRLLSMPIIYPPLSEQIAIANYLDNKCENIDTLVESEEKVIVELKEYKKSITQKATTKGILKCEFKDSGAEWFNDIPLKWDTVRIGNIYQARNTKVSDKEYQPLSVGYMGVVPQLENAAKTDNGDNRKLVLKNDFVINSRADRRGACGISNLDGSVSLINIVLKPLKNMCNNYFSYLFKSASFSEEFYKWGNGIVEDLWSTKWSEMKRIRIPFPPLPEQKAIAEYLDKKTEEVNKLIAIKKQKIDELKEYKKSLIYDCVTGKKEVV